MMAPPFLPYLAVPVAAVDLFGWVYFVLLLLLLLLLLFSLLLSLLYYDYYSVALLLLEHPPPLRKDKWERPIQTFDWQPLPLRNSLLQTSIRGKNVSLPAREEE
jgi:hypothetical protein